MEVNELQYTGYIMIGGSIIFVLLVVLLPAEIHLLLSWEHQDAELTDAGEDLLRTFSIIIAGLVISLAILIIGMSKNYNPELFPYLIGAVLIWFIVDSSSSLLFGYQYNIVLNTIFLFSFILVSYRIRERYQ